MRPKWTIGIATGLFFLYVSYFGVAGLGLTMYPSRITNLKAGMTWTAIDGIYTYSYTVTSVVGSVVNLHITGSDGSDVQNSFDVTNTSGSPNENLVVIASGLGIGDEIAAETESPFIVMYVNSTETVLGKVVLVSTYSETVNGQTTAAAACFYQDSGVCYQVNVTMNGGTFTLEQMTSADPVTSVTPTNQTLQTIIKEIFGNSKLMLFAGAFIGGISTIMLFVPKPKRQYTK